MNNNTKRKVKRDKEESNMERMTSIRNLILTWAVKLKNQNQRSKIERLKHKWWKTKELMGSSKIKMFGHEINNWSSNRE